jgi:hypothetical protein
VKQNGYSQIPATLHPGEKALGPKAKPAAKAPAKGTAKRKISAEGRARIVAAQKAQWAKLKKTPA